MTAPDHVDVGAYVLGILDEPAERAYERHFARCERCRREYVELADLPALLDTLRPEKAPPADLPSFEKLMGPLLGQGRPPELPSRRSVRPPNTPSARSLPAVPRQQRPSGATQPHRVPRPAPTTPPGDRTPRPVPRPGPGPAGRLPPAGRPPARPDPSQRTTPTRPSQGSAPPARPGARARRRPVWLAAAAAVLIAAVVGVVLGWPSGGRTEQVANPPGTAPASPPSGAVAGAHVVSGTDQKSGATAIITIEPVPGGTQIEMVLYQVDGPQNGTVFAVSRFGERVAVADWSVPANADTGEEVRASGVVSLAQQDINRFEVHGDGIEPLVVVST